MPFPRLAFLKLALVPACLGVISGSPAAAAPHPGEALYGQHCAVCHLGAADGRIPSRDALAKMPAEAILEAMTSGTMERQAAALQPAERAALAAFLSRVAGGPPELPAGTGACTDSATSHAKSSTNDPSWNGWSPDGANQRFQREGAGIDPDNVARLRLKWAFAYPATQRAYAQPTVINGRVYAGNNSRNFYSLDARSGCAHWSFETAAPVRAAASVGSLRDLPDGRQAVYIADTKANVYAVDVQSGELRWRTAADELPVAQVTGAPTLHEGRLYVPITSREELPSLNPEYRCCRYSGALAAIDAGTGKLLWRTRTIQEKPHIVGKNRDGNPIWGPSGAGIWSSPTIDPKRNAVYVATGDNHSPPATKTSDAILAMDLDTGELLWSKQMTAGDLFNMSCITPAKLNCPDPQGPDFDIGTSAALVKLAGGRRALVFGQKTGEVHAIDPDAEGRVLWTTRIGKGGILGGIQWGHAADDRSVYASLSDIAFLDEGMGDYRTLVADPKAGGGLFALDLATGKRRWHAPPAPCGKREACTPAQMSAIAVVPGVVFAGSMDGVLRAHSSIDGRLLWEFDTIRDFETVNGLPGKGGSMAGGGPAIVDGMLYVNSGYGLWGGTAGNVLLAFGVE